MRTIFIDRTRHHARIRALLVLRNRIATHPEEADALRAMTVADFDRLFSSPEVRLTVADILISGSDQQHEEFFGNLASGRLEVAPRVRAFLARSPLLERFIDPARHVVEPDPDLVREQWGRGLDLIDRLCSRTLSDIARCADLVAGLRYEWGEARGFSDPKIPGFIAFNVCAPPDVLAEQIVREATHVAVASFLDLDPRFRQLATQDVAAFSPFTESVRTVDRVVLGIISHFAVLQLWRAIADKPTTDSSPSGFGACGDRSSIVAQRIDELARRLRAALLFLSDTLEPTALESFSALFCEFFPTDEAFLHSHGTRKTVVHEAGYRMSSVALAPIVRAEILLAFAGRKVSRITVPMRSVAAIGFPLSAKGSVVPASWVVSPVSDDRLNGFSNVSGAERPVLEAGSEDEVHLYVSHDAALARAAAYLDGRGQAGEVLGIPECCRRWFNERWDDCRKRGGDLFADMVREYQRAGRLTVARECDASSMFRGGGLCWHFPCTPNCEATVASIRARRTALNAIDPELVGLLQSASVDHLWLDASGCYHTEARPDARLVRVDFS